MRSASSIASLDGYFVVGPRHVLLGPVSGEGFPLDLQVIRAARGAREERGRVHATRKPGGEILLSFEPLGDVALEDHVEILRLFARVCAQRSDFSLPLAIEVPAQCPDFLLDGFQSKKGGIWIRQPDPFLPPDRLPGLLEVYQDPFFVPWNFVPREVDLLRPAFEEAPAGPARWLDFGCGYGKNALLLEELGLEVFGFDLAASAVARCNSLSSHPGRFATADAAALPFASSSFDRVLDVGCLHCLPPSVLAGAVREIARVLTPNGRLYSRIFKPRSSAWMKEQPFRAERIGLDPDEVIATFGSCLRIERISETDKVLCVRGSRLSA